MADHLTGPVPLVGVARRARSAARPPHDLDPITARVVDRASDDELAARRRDRVRQVAVSLAWAVAATACVLVAGALGSPVLEGAGGALAPGASPLAPAPLTAAVGVPLALGLTAYVVWQWLPGRTGAARDRATGWWAAAALLLQAGWLGSVGLGSAAAGAAALLALSAVLVGLVSALHRTPASGPLERGLVDGTLGAWLGWVLLATSSHLGAAVGAVGLSGDPVLEPALALVALATLVALGRLAAVELGAPWALAAGLAWSVAGVAAGRIFGALGPAGPAGSAGSAGPAGPAGPGEWVVGLAALAAAAAILRATAAERRTTGS